MELRGIYDIMKMGPSANSCPARILFLHTPEAKARLLPALNPGNVGQDEASAGDGDRRLRHALLRVAAEEAVHASAGHGMSGFESNLLCNVGHGDPNKVLPRLPAARLRGGVRAALTAQPTFQPGAETCTDNVDGDVDGRRVPRRQEILHGLDHEAEERDRRSNDDEICRVPEEPQAPNQSMKPPSKRHEHRDVRRHVGDRVA